MSTSITANRRRALTIALTHVALEVLICALIGWIAARSRNGAVWGGVIGLVFGVVNVALSYRFAGGWLRRVSRARPADPVEFARFHNLVDGLSLSSGIPKPALYVIDDPAPNALTVGCTPTTTSVIFTTGLLALLDRVELEGVVAHELSHIKNGDNVPTTMLAVLLGWPSLLADLAIRCAWWNGGRIARAGDPADTKNPLSIVGFGLLVFAPLTSRSIRAFMPLEREAAADLGAIQLTRYPPGLIGALEKVRSDVAVSHAVSTATAHAWLEQPLSGVGDAGKLPRVHSWFITHPPIAERIELLREL